MKITFNWLGMRMQKLKDGTVPPQIWWLEKGHFHFLVLLQLSTQSEITCQTLIATKKILLNKKKFNQNKTIRSVASGTKQDPPLNVWTVGFRGGPDGEFPP